ncbi:rhodanese-like domain-containing protein [Jejuia pallidilutea]|uniref:rhodanese-like domain-containing protein n=1 Tax=Jejuia pallidilutea TaxID=504487 RepID=UPI0009E0A43A|nr:rhodanese-like domain-containing protein [Jejuia pallidilutea]
MKFFFASFICCLVLYNCNWYTDTSAILLEPKAFSAKIDKGGVQLIDVRTPKEYAEGHIENAININYYSKNFEDSLKLLDIKKPVYIYCRSGKRSAKSVSKFRAVGFDSIYELEGGMLNWRSEGFKANTN